MESKGPGFRSPGGGSRHAPPPRSHTKYPKFRYVIERIMAVRKSPEAREFLSLHRVQGCADPFHTRCARSARAGTRFSKLKVAPFLHAPLLQRDAGGARGPHAAFPGPDSSVAVGLSQPPPALSAATRLQRPYAAHRTLYARRPSHPLLAPSANAVRVDHERTGITAARARLSERR